MSERIDSAIDAVLKASGSALKNYSTQSTLDAMRAAMKKAMEPGWQPIETAPKDGSSILVWPPRRGSALSMRWDSKLEKWRVDIHSFIPFEQNEVTHWMPLPESPQ